ncbi:MAG TPA: c-type cytochrome domain-containing protein, partial [Candidatus Dormibacteraeota bacterium]|nr:c-type cytochrome domain-containing protein [Candidatus Dormibacteraeota bacterium]
MGGLLLAPTQGRAETIKPPRASALTYEKDIRPILKANCFDCHGEREKPKAGLDLRLRRLIVAGGESGPAIVPGKPKDSRLIDLVRRGEMPKREKKLSPAEVQLLERWVAAGAKTARPEPEQLPPGMSITEEERQHWAFQPIRRPEIPPHRPKDRVRTPVDAFLVAAMKPRGLNFSPDADRITLLRRAWLDLAGLPPSPEAVERFLA